VGTPSLKDGSADLSQIISAAEKIKSNLKQPALLVLKSTVPVGTIDILRNSFSPKKKEGRDFEILVNPEFLREGKGFYDFFHPSRIIIGGGSKKARKIMRELYSFFIKKKIPYLETDIKTAKLIKYASNAFLAGRISFINEIASICEKVGANIDDLRKGMGYDKRIGFDYLEPGVGFGGPCLEKDLKAILKISEEIGYEANFLKSILERNEKQIKIIIGKIKELVGPVLFRKPITIFGLAFKAGTDDFRNSISLKIIEELKKEGSQILVYDSVVKIKEEKGIKQFFSPYLAVENSFCLVILTDWPEFKKLDYQKIKKKMFALNIVDGKNILDPQKMRKLGFRYSGVGRS